MLKKFTAFMLCAFAVATLKLYATEGEIASINESGISEETVTALTTVVSNLPEESFNAFSGVIRGNKVRLRTAPRLDAHVVREIAMGEMFAVVGEINDFYAVLPQKGTKGFVFRTFVLEGTVEGERVNVRLYPDIEAPVVAQLHVGEKLDATLCETNNKWLEIDLSERGRFYVSKEYIEKAGPVSLVSERETRYSDASHLLSSALHFAQSEILKSFEEIDLEKVTNNFEKIISDYSEFNDLTEKAKEMDHLIQDIYLQKKISFLEQKADRTVSSSVEKELKSDLEKLSFLAKEIGEELSIDSLSFNAEVVSQGKENVCPAETIKEVITDKMLVWQPLEESLFHMWAIVNGEKSMEEFYQEEVSASCLLEGIIESYDRPVKNRPGDFLLKVDNQTVGFLYSTKVNLAERVGKHVSLRAAPRPNNNFAYRAYFVLSME